MDRVGFEPEWWVEPGSERPYRRLETLISLIRTVFFGGVCLIFIGLVKTKGKPTKQNTIEFTKMLDSLNKVGIKILNIYWTLGRYDGIVIFEAKTEKDAMKFAIGMAEDAKTETMVAVPREEALKLL